MPQSIINCENLLKADVLLLGAGYDRTSSGGKGADKGPAAIRWALDTQIEFYHPYTNTSPAEKLNIGFLNFDKIGDRCTEIVIDEVSFTFSQHYISNRSLFVITLGGKHTVTIGIAKALRNLYYADQVTFLQIDAHFDLRDTDEDYNDNPSGKYAHSTVMRRVYEYGFNIVSFGIRSYSKEELEFAKTPPGKNKIVPLIWGVGGTSLLSPYEVIRQIPTRDVYLTIDIDGISPGDMPSTGTPVLGGPSYDFVQKLVRLLFQHRNVIAADIMEIAPRSFYMPKMAPDSLSENDRVTTVGAAQLVYDMIAEKFQPRESNVP